MLSRVSVATDSGQPTRERLLDLIRDKALISGGSYRLASGNTSAFYFYMKPVTCDPEGSRLIADLILDILEEEKVDFIGGLEIGAIPIMISVVQRSFDRRPVPGFFVRKISKGHGTEELIEGNLERGSNVIVLDDVTTTGKSVFRAVEAVRDRDCTVKTVITVVDREEGAESYLKKHGIILKCLFTKNEFLQ